MILTNLQYLIVLSSHNFHGLEYLRSCRILIANRTRWLRLLSCYFCSHSSCVCLLALACFDSSSCWERVQPNAHASCLGLDGVWSLNTVGGWQGSSTSAERRGLHFIGDSVRALHADLGSSRFRFFLELSVPTGPADSAFGTDACHHSLCNSCSSPVLLSIVMVASESIWALTYTTRIRILLLRSVEK